VRTAAVALQRARNKVWRHNVHVIKMSSQEFEHAVGDALDEVPEDLARMMSNVVVLVDDEPPDGRALLGLYEGTPLTERDEWWAAGSLPDRITIFRNPTLRMCASREQVVQQVKITVVHEIAHHFGIDDDRLHELGWA
jgi:predicted Zn-dependent protease with MMP-like domain